MGNISLRVIGTLCTVGVLVAVYFFIVKPAADTTNNTVNAISDSVNSVNKQIDEAQDQAKAAQELGGSSASGVNTSKLSSCMQKAQRKQSVNLVQKCAAKYGAGAP